MLYTFDRAGNECPLAAERAYAIHSLFPSGFPPSVVVEACARVIGAAVANSLTSDAVDASEIFERVVDGVLHVARKESGI